MEYYACFLASNKRGVIGWTVMKFDGLVYWHPTDKWYSSYKVAKKMRDRLNAQLESKST